MACAWLAACAPRDTVYEAGFLAMGTEVTASLVAPANAAGRAHAARELMQIERELVRQGNEWYAWGQGGELVRLNHALAAGESIEISAPLAELLRRAQQLRELSAGYVDPAVAPMVKAWGFDRADRDPAQPPPTPAELQQWRNRHATLADLHLQIQVDGRVLAFSTRRDLQLDLGALGKGYLLELARDRLRADGMRAALLNAGGKLVAMGSQLNQPWTVALRNPRGGVSLATLELREGESLATSGDYERYAVVGAQRIQHVLDPHLGEPVAHTRAITVLTHDAMLADAASTALMAAGPNHWQRIAEQMQVDAVLRMDASGAIEVTAALYARLHWNPAATQSHAIRILP